MRLAPVFCLASSVAALSLALTLGAAAPSAAVADAAWSFPDWPSFPNGTTGLTRPRVIADSLGGLHAVWTGPDAFGRDTVWVAERVAGQAWQAPARVWVASAGEAAALADVAIDSRGSLHVAWTGLVGGQARILHAVRSPIGRWAAPEAVSAEASRGMQDAASVAADFWGNLLLAWTDFRRAVPAIAYRRRLPSGQWSPAVAAPFPAGGDQHGVRLAVMRSGWTYAVWEDTRAGTGAIFSSALPPGGDVWWPAAQLSHAGGRRQHAPAVSADGAGNVVAVWIDEGELTAGGEDSELDVGALRAAVLAAPEPFWSADREIYRPARGRLLSVDVAGAVAAEGGTSGAIVVWGESRPQGTRVYAATWKLSGTLTALRVDAFAATVDGRLPSATVAATGRAHVVWLARSPLGPGVGVAHAAIDIETAQAAPAAAEGWLSYSPNAANCAGAGYILTDCEGSTSPFIYEGGADLDPLLGQYVTVSGSALVAGGCRFVNANRVKLMAMPCPRDTGGIAGSLTAAGARPARGATVELAETEVTAGADGRFFLDGLDEGRYTVTASLPCALTAVITDVQVRARVMTVLPPSALVLGDVARNCAVDLADLTRVAARLRQPPHESETCADLDEDGIVSLLDLEIIRASYGLSCPQPWHRRRRLDWWVMSSRCQGCTIAA